MKRLGKNSSTKHSEVGQKLFLTKFSSKSTVENHEKSIPTPECLELRLSNAILRSLFSENDFNITKSLLRKKIKISVKRKLRKLFVSHLNEVNAASELFQKTQISDIIRKSIPKIELCIETLKFNN